MNLRPVPFDPKAELDQNGREAIVELVHFCVYADARIALDEGDFLGALPSQLGWPAQSSYSSYEGVAVATARAARESEEACTHFLSTVAQRLGSPAAKRYAVELCKTLMRVDGTTAAREDELVAKIQAALK
jgi:hypothetical protein